MSKAITFENDEYVIRMENIIIGSIVPNEDETLFKVKMGAYGGYYNIWEPFDNALNRLTNASINNYARRLKRVQVGAKLIYKRNKNKGVHL